MFDNAASAATLRPHLPQVGPHHVLITSRNPSWSGVARPVPLDVWGESEGADFLAARLKQMPQIELLELSRVLGGLPLALEQAAAFLEETGGSVASYRAQVASVDSSKVVLDEGRASTGYERSVFATLSLAFPQLSGGAQQVLRICGFLSAEPIPERYFHESDDAAFAALSDANSAGLAWERAMGELRRYGLAERIDIAALDRVPGQPDQRMEKALVLHRLTQEVVRHALAVAAEDVLRAQKILDAQCPRQSESPEHWARFAALLPHVASLDRVRPLLDPRVHAIMLGYVGSYLYDAKALYADALRWLRSGLELAAAHFGEEDPDTLGIANSLGKALLDSGDLVEARALLTHLLPIVTRVFGDNALQTLSATNNLAFVLKAQGHYAEARVLEEDVVQRSGRLLGEDHPSTLICTYNLASTLRIVGHLERGRLLHEQVLRARVRVLGEDDPQTLASMNAVARCLRDDGEFAEACILHERVISAARRVLGEEHRETLTAMNDFAITLHRQGDLTKSRALDEHVLSVRRRKLGPAHPDTVASMNNLALTLLRQGELERARDLQQEVLEAQKRRVGEGHIHTLEAICNLAGTLWALKSHDEAIELMAVVVAGLPAYLGATHPEVLRAAEILAEWRQQRAGAAPH